MSDQILFHQIVFLKTFSSCHAIFVHGRNDENFGMKIYYDFLNEKEKPGLDQ